LICSDYIAVLREYNIASHYSQKHREQYKTFVPALRTEKVAALKWELVSWKNVFRKEYNSSDEEFIKKSLEHKEKEFVQKINCFQYHKSVSWNKDAVCWRNETKESERPCLALEESNDTSDIAQLINSVW